MQRSLGGAAQRRWWKHYSLNSLKTPQGTPGVPPQTCARDKHGPLESSCFSDSQVFWMLIPICFHQQKERDRGEMRVGRSDGPGLKGHTPGPTNAAAAWSCDHREAGKSPPKRGEQLKLSATVSTHFNLFSVQIFIDSLPHAKLCANSSLRLDWAAPWSGRNGIHSTEDLLGSACHPRRKDKENIFWKFIEWF